MNSSLKKKTIVGISWNLVDRFAIQIIKFIVVIILARLLGPKDFGLVGITMVFFTLAQVFVDSGFGQAFIQKKEINDIDSNTLFFTNIFLGIFSYILLWFLAPLIAQFYNESILVNLVRYLALIVIINSFIIIQNSKLIRSLNFKRRSIINLISIISSGIISIFLALNNYGIWSLVNLYLLNKTFILFGLWFSSDWKPKFEFSKKSFDSMFSFGFWVLSSSLLRTFFDNIYILFIGKTFSISQLGFYSKSKQFQQFSSINISQAVGNVAFPIFSKLQNDNEQLHKSFRFFLMFTFSLLAPILITLIVAAEPIVLLLLTDKWSPMIPYMQLLCLIGIFYPIHLLNIQLLISKGKTNLNFRLEIIKNFLRVINISLMYKFGIIFIIYGELVVSFISLFINTFYIKQIINYGIFKQLKDLKNILLCSIISGYFGFFCSNFFENLFSIFCSAILITLLSYTILFYFFNKNIFFKIKDFLIDLRR